jgi:hypothetical protein
MHIYSPIYSVLPFSTLYAVAGTSLSAYVVAANLNKLALFANDGTGWKTIVKLSDAKPTDELFFGVVKENKDGKLHLLKSAGQKFKAPWVTTKSQKNYSAANDLRLVPKLNPGQSLKDVEGIRVEFINPEYLYQSGYNQNIKFYPINPGCVDACTDPCSITYTNVDMYKSLLPNMKGDIDAEMFSIEKLVVDTTTLNNPTYEQAMAALNGAAVGVDATLVLKMSSTKVYEYGKVNLKYSYPRQTTIVATMAQSCNQVSLHTNAQALIPATIAGAIIPIFAYEQGNGYDMKQVEFKAAHWNGLDGYPIGKYYFTENGYKFQVDENKKYHQYIINRANEGTEGMFNYQDAMADIFLFENTVAMPITIFE